jgi:hypothetical protein
VTFVGIFVAAFVFPQADLRRYLCRNLSPVLLNFVAIFIAIFWQPVVGATEIDFALPIACNHGIAASKLRQAAKALIRTFAPKQTT